MNNIFINGQLRGQSPQVIANRQHGGNGKFFNVYIEDYKESSEPKELIVARETIERLEKELMTKNETIRVMKSVFKED